jgi:hypothetical protein
MDNEPAICSAVTCFATSWAGYEATPEQIDKLKNGEMLQIAMLGLPSLRSPSRELPGPRND